MLYVHMDPVRGPFKALRGAMLPHEAQLIRSRDRSLLLLLLLLLSSPVSKAEATNTSNPTRVAQTHAGTTDIDADTTISSHHDPTGTTSSRRTAADTCTQRRYTLAQAKPL